MEAKSYRLAVLGTGTVDQKKEFRGSFLEAETDHRLEKTLHMPIRAPIDCGPLKLSLGTKHFQEFRYEIQP